MKFTFSFLIFFLLCKPAFAKLPNSENPLDALLHNKIKLLGLNPSIPLNKNPNFSQIELGKRLFMDTNLSGNRNVSCMTCHNSIAGTSDLLPLSRTENSNGILRRNSLSLFNLGNNPFIFWDGRVSYDKTSKIFSTPEKNLPISISNVLTSALSAQALFPMVSHDEMRGQKGENEIGAKRSTDQTALNNKASANDLNQNRVQKQLDKSEAGLNKKHQQMSQEVSQEASSSLAQMKAKQNKQAKAVQTADNKRWTSWIAGKDLPKE